MNEKNKNWIPYTVLFFTLFCLSITASIFTGLWALSAIPTGLLFGFFLQKGDLCGASAFSEVILLKSWEKFWGLWICIIVSMLGFALLDIFNVVTLNIKPFIWLSYIVGGVLFGIGMVLAGGCVSGCLFKAATGNINSIAALITIPLGVALVESGPLKPFNLWMKQYIIKMPDSSPVSLQAVTRLPYWSLAVLFFFLTILALFYFKNAKPKTQTNRSFKPSFKSIFTKSWKPWHAGIAIGLLAMFAYISSAHSGRNYPLGTTHGVYFLQVLITDFPVKHVIGKPVVDKKLSQNKVGTPNPVPPKKVSLWLVLVVISLMAGSFLSGKISGAARLLHKPPEQTLVAIFGGLLVGTGAGFAKGCVVGNILSGWALMSVGTLFFGGVVILSNWAATYLYLMGGSILATKE